jgi:hypothetical protein
LSANLADQVVVLLGRMALYQVEPAASEQSYLDGLRTSGR